MGTWTGSSRDKIAVEELSGGTRAVTYSIAAVATNTGGTLTTSGLKKIDNFSLNGNRVTGPTGLVDLLGYISGKTVVVTHGDPGENATVIVKVWGPKG
jgi:hypothetical protein